MFFSSCLRLRVDKDFPQPRYIAHAAAVLQQGGVIVYPTDTTYSIGCSILKQKAIERIYQLKDLPREHHLSLVCPDLSDLKRYARLDPNVYDVLKQHLPGQYTFILAATPEVPKIFQSAKNTVGIRVPNHAVPLALARTLRSPIVSTTAKIKGRLLCSAEEISQYFGSTIDLLLDVGPIEEQYSSVVDLSGPYPVVERYGAGDVSWALV